MSKKPQPRSHTLSFHGLLTAQALKTPDKESDVQCRFCGEWIRWGDIPNMIRVRGGFAHKACTQRQRSSR